MPAGYAEAGLASKLESLTLALDLSALNIEGDGYLRIDEGRDPPRIEWVLNQQAAFDDFGHADREIGGTIRSLEHLSAKAIASGGPRDPTLGPAILADRSKQSGSGFDADPQNLRSKDDSYMARVELLKDLKDEAVNDGYILNPVSEIDFRHFVRSAPRIRKGNLRAIWKDREGSRLGLQFLGGGMVQ